jgi:HD-like signal output (HDOD) protein
MPIPDRSAAELAIEQIERKMVWLLQTGSVVIPAYPAVAARLRGVLNAPGYKIADLVSLIAGDQTVAAQILQLANSGAHAGKSPSTNLQSAVMRIGEREVQRIAIAASLGGATAAAGPLAELRRSIWRRSVIAGQLAQILASQYSLADSDLFMAGLLHDFGAIVAVCAIENTVQSLGPDFTLDAERWEALVERYHVHLGMTVAQKWSLPQQICDIMAMHHSSKPEGPHAEAVRFIQRIDNIVAIIDSSVTLAPELFTPLGLSEQVIRAVLAAMPKILQQLSTFEPPASATTARSAVTARPPRIGRPDRDANVCASIVNANARQPLTVTKAGPLGMLATAQARIGSTQVLRLHLEIDADGLEMWVTAQSVDEASLTYELTPFASDANVSKRYATWLNQR